MATFNGEKYIEEQINSILNQTYLNLDLFVRDDGSTDRTVEIVNSYIKKDKRVHLVSCGSNAKGACLNFYKLIQYAKEALCEYDYYFLSDQDDIWYNEKVEQSIIEAETVKNNRPVLVYSDLLLMNENGDDNNEKMSDFHDINLKNPNNIYFDQIYVWGNTICINNKMLGLVNIPISIYNQLSHDHYLAFYGASFGVVKYVDKPLVKYRRHENNLSDLPASYSVKDTIMKIFTEWKKILRRHVQSFQNVLFFIENAPTKTETMHDVENAIRKGGLGALRIIRKYKIKAGSNIQNEVATKLILLLGLHRRMLK